MDFEWDEVKALANERKHGVSFLEATEVFGDDLSSCVRDPDHSHGEERYLLFGVSSKRNFLVVSYTERSDTIRIISARRMSSQERKAYEQ
jgi:uncharacterized DUF497 family protein